MGMDRVISIAKLPSWASIARELADRNLPAQLRMIDGQLAFPDEQPPGDWRELRISVTGGMVTLRRESSGVRLVIWENADAQLQQSVAFLCEVLATLGAS